MKIAKKNQKNKTDSKKKDHLTVVLEDMNSKFDLVLEGHQVLDKKIDNFREEVDQRFNEVDQRFNKVDQRFNEVDYKFEVVFDELRIIRNELKEKVSRDEFSLLEKRVIDLEKKLAKVK